MPAKRAVDADKRGPIRNADPADSITAVVKSDTNDVWGVAYNATTSRPCRGLLVGTAGSATVIDANGNTAALIPLQQGYNPIRVKQIKNVGDAGDIWALE